MPEQCKRLERTVPNITVCLQQLFGVSLECAHCHAVYATELPKCIPSCAKMMFHCKNLPEEPITRNCWTKVADCVYCTTPPTEQNMRCTGGYPEEGFRLVKDFVQDITMNSSFDANEKFMTFWNQAYWLWQQSQESQNYSQDSR
mmetsp:Transcript_34600/g.80343  ORF Transcript_34600/g.80343 Transcript_34600/m.80343 type:complete len:144 (+) Transcript_34600:54-485(+)